MSYSCTTIINVRNFNASIEDEEVSRLAFDHKEGRTELDRGEEGYEYTDAAISSIYTRKTSKPGGARGIYRIIVRVSAGWSATLREVNRVQKQNVRAAGAQQAPFSTQQTEKYFQVSTYCCLPVQYQVRTSKTGSVL